MSHLTTAQLAEIAKVTKRQIQRVLETGTPDIGASRTPGGHWLIPDTPAVRKWAKSFKRWVRVKRGVLDPVIFQPGKLVIAPDASQEKWKDIHRNVLLNRRRGWLKQSRNFAIGKWGVDYTADIEVGLEFELGILPKDKPASLNYRDKSIAIVTIEGISHMFSMWHRKMANEIQQWDSDRLDRAIRLLEYPARVHAQMVALRSRLPR